MSDHLTDDDHDTVEDYEARKLQADYDAKRAELAAERETVALLSRTNVTLLADLERSASPAGPVKTCSNCHHLQHDFIKHCGLWTLPNNEAVTPHEIGNFCGAWTPQDAPTKGGQASAHKPGATSTS